MMSISFLSFISIFFLISFPKVISFGPGTIQRVSSPRATAFPWISYPVNLTPPTSTKLFAADDEIPLNNDEDYDANEMERVKHDLDILETRLRNLEALTASQQVDLRKLKNENDELVLTLRKLSELIDVLKDAGLTGSNIRSNVKRPRSGVGRLGDEDEDEEEEYYLVDDVDSDSSPMLYEYEYFDDEEIFGSAPSSVIEAADSAGAAILAAMLAGQRRMLVDVRDAELTNNPEVLAQFVELSVLPVAAGLEGLNAERNRVKIVFPTVSQLLEVSTVKRWSNLIILALTRENSHARSTVSSRPLPPPMSSPLVLSTLVR